MKARSYIFFIILPTRCSNLRISPKKRNFKLEPMLILGPFISILTDFGFKFVFADATDTSFLRKVIQIMIQSEIPIKEVHIDNTHQTADDPRDRGAVYDVSCTDENGREFVVEMQRTNLCHFIHRLKFYSNFRFNEMVEKGDEIRDDKLRPIYTISFLDGKVYPTRELHHIVCLRNQHGDLIDDQVTHIMLELGKWNKAEHEVTTDLDKLILLMKFTDTATTQDAIPTALAETPWAAEILEKLRTNNLSSRDRIRYKDALIQKLSQKADNDTYKENLEKAQQEIEAAQQEAKVQRQEAEAQRQKAEIAEQKAEAQRQQMSSAIKELLRQGTFTEDNIAQLFGVDIEYVRQIKNGLES